MVSAGPFVLAASACPVGARATIAVSSRGDRCGRAMTPLMCGVLEIVASTDDEQRRLRQATSQLKISSTRYYQLVLALLAVPEAWSIAPDALGIYRRRLQAHGKAPWRRRAPAGPCLGTPP